MRLFSNSNINELWWIISFLINSTRRYVASLMHGHIITTLKHLIEPRNQIWLLNNIDCDKLIQLQSLCGNFLHSIQYNDAPTASHIIIIPSAFNLSENQFRRRLRGPIWTTLVPATRVIGPFFLNLRANDALTWNHSQSISHRLYRMAIHYLQTAPDTAAKITQLLQ